MNRRSTLTIGTRGSALAVAQTESVARLLAAANSEIDVRIVTMSTRADRIQDRPISALGDKGVFVRPLQAAVLAGDIDIAVHSLKDVPADVEVPGLQLSAFPMRADPRDALVSTRYGGLADLPAGATVGTGSLRRRALLLQRRPDLRVVDIRGNVDTRLGKLDSGEYDAIVLAVAGLTRLGLEHRIRERFDPEWFVPDAGQGMLAVETRSSGAAAEAAARIDRAEFRVEAVAERSVVRALGAGCHSPVGAYARVEGATVHIVAMAAPPAGGEPRWERAEGPSADAAAVGGSLGEQLLARLR